MVASHWASASAQTPSRRRGAVLERAILEAALDQLGTVGWNGLTMEGVAAGAQTGKAAVYRRWPSKEDLVADALRSGLPDFDTAPDRGSVREDLLELCRRARDAVNGYVCDAIPAMMMYRSKICASEWTDRELEEMIDQLMIPLLRPDSP